MKQGKEWSKKGKEKKKFQNYLGGILCLGLLFFLAQGMLFLDGTFLKMSEDFQKTSPVWNKDMVKEEVQADSGEEEKQEVKKVAYLTFDDGPSILTPQYLEILREEEVCATFFLIGQQVEGEMVDVVKQAIDEGHEIGMHTYCHEAEKIYASSESYCMDLEKTKQCMKEKLKIEPKIFRFPWGSKNSYVQGYKNDVIDRMKEEGIDYVDWNVSGEDSVGCPSPDSILSNIRKDYKKYNDPVILLHDSATCKSTLYALRGVIRELKADGYSFGTLSGRETPCHFGE